MPVVCWCACPVTRWCAHSPWDATGHQCAYPSIQPPFKSQQRLLFCGWKQPGQALGKQRRENIFFHSLCFPFCPSFAISWLSKFTGALPQGEMKAPGCVWWCWRGGRGSGRVKQGGGSATRRPDLVIKQRDSANMCKIK